MSGEPIAVVGLALRFPGSSGVEEFWDSLVQGRESISRISDDDLVAAHDGDRSVLTSTDLVPAAGLVTGIEEFDAEFFGLTAREAELMDPQQRLLLETAVEAFEDSGHDPARVDATVGVFMGIGRSSYFLHHLLPRTDLLTSFARQISLFNDKDYAATQISHRLGLTGPSMSISTACSSSLVTIHQACKSLADYECDMALAGGASVNVMQLAGYVHQEGNIFSPDGHCRAFDAEAAGTVSGNGAGVVMLKRLSEAVRDGDPIRAVIRGSAVNNDGSEKVGFTAPSVHGQSAVIFEALQNAGVPADSIGYVEAHGTGTPLGDPIEIAALTDAFRITTSHIGFCAIGSVKTNIGHLDTAAGVAGFIKTVLAVERGQIPPSLHYRHPNPAIDFDRSPFFVSTTSRPWAGEGPRRAGVSSFGMGGTNVHMILEQSPVPDPVPASAPPPPGREEMLLLSARTPAALHAMRERLARHLREHPEQPLADIAHTLDRGRARWSHRAAVLGATHDQCAEALSGPAIEARARADATVVWLLAGQGSQHPRMAQHLYAEELAFRAAFDECDKLARPHLDRSLHDLLYGREPADLTRTDWQQPALFAVQYALARHLGSWGIAPAAIAGHSLGELVAATLAGVWSLPDAVGVVCARAALMHEQPPGAMIAAVLDPERAQRYISDGECTVAAINAPNQVVLAGTLEAAQAVQAALTADHVPHRRLATSHAFHSPLMAPASEGLHRHLASVVHHPPTIPFISNTTGTWITDQQATDPAYWAQQLRRPVRFSAGLRELLADHPDALLLEAGPGRTATTLARHQPGAEQRVTLVTVPGADQDSGHTVRMAIAALWTHGREHTSPTTHHLARLPTYPFDRQRHWIERPTAKHSADLFTTVFREAPHPMAALDAAAAGEARGCWLVFADRSGTGDQWADQLRALGRSVVVVEAADGYAAAGADRYRVRPQEPEDFQRLCEALADRDGTWNVLYRWALDAGDEPEPARVLTLDALVNLARGIGRHRGSRPTHLAIVTGGLAAVRGGETVSPLQAMTLGPARTLPLEYPSLAASVIDVDTACPDVAAVRAELEARLPAPFVAHRAGMRYVENLAEVKPTGLSPLRKHGVYLITGGFGGIGSALALRLAQTHQARLVLTGRTPIPARDQWPAGDDGDPALRHRIGLVRRLESLGAEVHTESFDITDSSALSDALDRAEQRFGPIEGVIHAAGLTGGGLAQFQTAEAMRRVVAPKVAGTRALAAALRDRGPVFLAVLSSTAALLGSLGQVEYVAANAFLDAWARSGEAPPGTVAIAWDGWQETGMTSAERIPDVGVAHADRAVLPVPEALTAFERVLCARERNVVVAAENLTERFAERATRRSETSAQPPAKHSRATVEATLISIWTGLFGREVVERDANFFDLGGDSLLIIEAGRQIRDRLQVSLSVPDLFGSPTLTALTNRLAPSIESTAVSPAPAPPATDGGDDDAAVAVIGMALRFPGANTVEEFWTNLVNGVESIVPTNETGTADRGSRGAHVAVSGAPEGVDQFDAAFFGFSPREAEIMDPQQRLLLMCSHEALEDAGYDPPTVAGEVAVYMGTAMSSYLLNNLIPHRGASGIDPTSVAIGNDKDFAATQISYRLNLRGPSVSVSTACSTSLVAIAHACKSLLSGESDLAIAGGARIRVPAQAGYWYQEGGITSPDGHCRAFDAEAGGTVFTSGAGVVVLKRLSDAVRDQDSIRAVIRGSAVNNDGSDKVGFTAPSVRGQTTVISQALSNAGVPADSIGYVEAHGTATSLGDPVEIAALTDAFGTERTGYCAIGSVKTNIGHLDAAAGIAGFIKAVLAVERGQIPPSLHYRRPNPRIDFATTPFYVNVSTRPWHTEGPRRAGVSSFGIGGTNAHVILEEPPAPAPRSASIPAEPASGEILLLSAKTPTALAAMRHRLAQHLREHPEQPLADVAHTLRAGRVRLAHRAAVVGADRDECANSLTQGTDLVQAQASATAETVFLIAGPGTQQARMTRHLHDEEPTFRAAFDECTELAGFPLSKMLHGHDPADLTSASLQQPALFAVQYALARHLAAWGIHPAAIAGHGLGELVAATLAGVWSLPDAVGIVLARAALLQQQPPGVMVAVALDPEQAQGYATDGCTIAAVNAPNQTVLAGPVPAMEHLQRTLSGRRIPHHLLATSHALGTPLMAPAAEQLELHLKAVTYHPPRIPFVSGTTGHWITEQQATDPSYWARQLGRPVQFSAGLTRLLADHPEALLLELGPGTTATTLIHQHPGTRNRLCVAAVPTAGADSAHTTRKAIATLWAHGIEHSSPPGSGRRVPLPIYPFETSRHWIDAPADRDTAAARQPYAAPASTVRSEPALTEPVFATPVFAEPALAEPVHEVSTVVDDRPEDVDGAYTAPRTPTEKTLVGIFESVLGTSPIGVHDDFFDLGGDSFMALQILSRITEELGVDLPHQTVLEATTAAQLAAAVPADAPEEPAAPCLMRLREGAEPQVPLFLVHPVGGGLYLYQSLVRRLDAGSTIYGFQAAGLDGRSTPTATVEEMASRYLRELQQVQPDGPIALGGAGFGGLVAVEMAERLQAAGEPVHSVVLFDTPGPGQMPLNHHGDLDEASAVELVGSRLAERGLVADDHLDVARPVFEVYRSNLEALHTYRPRRYAGRVVYFLAERRRAGIDPDRPDTAWQEMVDGDLAVHRMPCDYPALFRDETIVAAVAEVLSRHLAVQHRPGSGEES